MHFGFGMRQAALLLGVLGLALGGCGTMSGGLSSESLRAATAAAPTDTTEASEPVAAALAPDAQPTGAVVAEPHAGEQLLTPTVAFSPASFALMPESEQPSFMVASLTPLMVSQVTGPRLAQSSPAEPTAPSEGVLEEYDPWEPFNEKMFTFNYNMDKYVLKPIAKAYNFVMPDRLQQMIDSGFDNLLVVPRVVNNLLQWRPKGAGAELGRFLINSTFGIGGLFDIAKQEFGLQKTRVDFGQTLGIWGVSPGPFLVLPFLPPLTVRDGIGTAVDGAMDPLSYVLPFIWTRLGMKIGNTINDRALNLDLYQGFEETTVDLYSAVRNGYLQRRQNLITAPPPY
ncbi:MAG TPA: VacJ family lipoprotein [Methylomirabilota bacterium]|nr:VacJ family lipoprotein [Methylomirabilota bacterium]